MTEPRSALVELFTSEGCSSCPPADALLGRLAEESERAGRPVYCLSYHVDYWDRLGWKDRFSSPEFTRRQREYARRFRLASVYTPQMVVNGTDQFVGSNARAAEAAVEASLAKEGSVRPTLRASAHGHEVDVVYRVTHPPEGAVLHVAWVESRAVSAPNRGENDGRKLRHVNVVRDLRTLPLASASDGRVRLTRPAVVDGSVIAWVQSARTGPVLGAASTRVAAR